MAEESSKTLIKSFQLTDVFEEKETFKCSKFYIIIHAIIVSLISIIMVYFEFMLTQDVNYLTQYVLISAPINIMIGFYFIFIAFLSLFISKF